MTQIVQLMGKLFLHRSGLNVPDPGGQHVLTSYAEPGSQSARALDELRFGSAE